LLYYGADLVDIFRRAASYVDRILRGEKPGDLPVQFPTKFEMVVNRRTAKALGLEVPPSILLRAEEQIEYHSRFMLSFSDAGPIEGLTTRTGRRPKSCSTNSRSASVTVLSELRSGYCGNPSHCEPEKVLAIVNSC
jgi:hypothetical protein